MTETTTTASKPMTAQEAVERSVAERPGDPAVVAKVLDYYRRAIEQEAEAGNFSVLHPPAKMLENRVTRHDLAEVQDALLALGYTVDAAGVRWDTGWHNHQTERGGILARAINTRFVRRGDAGADGQ